VNQYSAEAFAAGRIADFHREAAAARVASLVPRADRPHPWTALATRFATWFATRFATWFATWAERPRAGRSVGVCCPA
jgi:hypothetical protein